MIKSLLLVGFLLGNFALLAQTSLSGKVTDSDTGEKLIGANITLSQNDVFLTGTSTDFNGDYKIMLQPGEYTLVVQYIGYPNKKITVIVTQLNKSNKLDLKLAGDNPDDYRNIGYGCWHYKVPLINRSETSSGNTIPDTDIELMPNKNINRIIENTPGVSIINW